MRRLQGDAGQVGGIEAVPFGLLVLLVGILLVAHTWAVVDAKFLTTAAAREATRAYVEAPDAARGVVDARLAADESVTASGRVLDDVVRRRRGGDFARCSPARFETEMTVPAFGVPWRGDRPVVRVRSAHEELVDPFRDGLPGAADCGAP
jgi:hypothetical protein